MKTKIDEQIIHLQKKGFIIKDEEKIRGYLEKVGLYRLSRYFINFKNNEGKMDLFGVDFEEIINHYLFDKNLRYIIFDFLEVIENSFKNLFILYIGDNYNNKNFYNDAIFKDGKTKADISIEFIENKIKELKGKDPDCKENITTELFINKLMFGEIVKIFINLKEENKYKILDYYGIISLAIFENWILSLKYLRNLVSHSENIFNRKMTIKIKGGDIGKKFGMKENDKFISYFMILSILKEKLICNFAFEEKIFKKISQYNIDFNLFGQKKETFHSEHENKSEAWKVLINPLYRKYVKKSNFNKTFSIILAVDEKNGLGKNNTLAWNLKADLNYFKNITTETQNLSKINAVLMGINTWKSIPEKYKPLPNRINCVLSRDLKENNTNDFVLYYNDFERCLEDVSKKSNVENIFLIGGASLYNQMRNHKMLDKIYITRILGNYDCDVFFDGIDDDKFEIISKSKILEENDMKFRFEIYKKLA